MLQVVQWAWRRQSCEPGQFMPAWRSQKTPPGTKQALGLHLPRDTLPGLSTYLAGPWSHPAWPHCGFGTSPMRVGAAEALSDWDKGVQKGPTGWETLRPHMASPAMRAHPSPMETRSDPSRAPGLAGQPGLGAVAQGPGQTYLLARCHPFPNPGCAVLPLAVDLHRLLRRQGASTQQLRTFTSQQVGSLGSMAGPQPQCFHCRQGWSPGGKSCPTTQDTLCWVLTQCQALG